MENGSVSGEKAPSTEQDCDKGKCSSQFCRASLVTVPSGFAGTPLPFHGQHCQLLWGGVCSLHSLFGPLTHCWLHGHFGYILVFTCLRSSSLVLCIHLIHSAGMCLAWSLGSSANTGSRLHTSSRTHPLQCAPRDDSHHIPLLTLTPATTALGHTHYVIRLPPHTGFTGFCT